MRGGGGGVGGGGWKTRIEIEGRFNFSSSVVQFTSCMSFTVKKTIDSKKYNSMWVGRPDFRERQVEK